MEIPSPDDQRASTATEDRPPIEDDKRKRSRELDERSEKGRSDPRSRNGVEEGQGPEDSQGPANEPELAAQRP